MRCHKLIDQTIEALYAMADLPVEHLDCAQASVKAKTNFRVAGINAGPFFQALANAMHTVFYGAARVEALLEIPQRSLSRGFDPR